MINGLLLALLNFATTWPCSYTYAHLLFDMKIFALRFTPWRGVFLAYTLGGLLIYLLAVLIIMMSNSSTLMGILIPGDFGRLSAFLRTTSSYVAATNYTVSWPHEALCKGPICLDESIGASLLREEIQHLRNILYLVDGFGRPLGRIFDLETE